MTPQEALNCIGGYCSWDDLPDGVQEAFDVLRSAIKRPSLTPEDHAEVMRILSDRIATGPFRDRVFAALETPTP